MAQNLMAYEVFKNCDKFSGNLQAWSGSVSGNMESVHLLI